MSARLRRLGFSLVLALSFAGPLACDRASLDEGERERPRSSIDSRLETHAVLDATPSAEGLAYLEAAATAHEQADRASSSEAVAILVEAAARPPVAGQGVTELVHYELLARAAEGMLELGQAPRALDLLDEYLATDISLPIDRAAARCLVAFGDAAAQTGDLALAMGSYARALDMLTLLLEEVES